MGTVVKVTLDAETFKALASPTRLTVLRALDARRKTLTEIAKDLDLNKATVLEHLTLLTGAGLVKKRDDEGRKWIYYELTWRGEKILHPQETTTFTVLLGLGAAAAGGGFALLGRSLGWWLTNKQMDAATPEDTTSAFGSGDSALSESDQKTGLTLDTSTNMDYYSDSAPTMSAPTPPSSGNETASTPAYEPTAGDGDGNATAPNDAPDMAAHDGNVTAPIQSIHGGAFAVNPPAPSPTAAPTLDAHTTSPVDAAHDSHFLDDGGSVAMALLFVSVLFGMLAYFLKRRLGPKGKPEDGP